MGFYDVEVRITIAKTEEMRGGKCTKLLVLSIAALSKSQLSVVTRTLSRDSSILDVTEKAIGMTQTCCI